jgi:hypothetical protein
VLRRIAGTTIEASQVASVTPHQRVGIASSRAAARYSGKGPQLTQSRLSGWQNSKEAPGDLVLSCEVRGGDRASSVNVKSSDLAHEADCPAVNRKR